MSSVLVELADGVAAALNAQAYSRPFTATRAWRLSLDLADMAGLYVTVAPAGMTTERAARGDLHQEDYTVDVIVREKPVPLDSSTLDALSRVTEEIADVLKNACVPLPALGSRVQAQCVGLTNTPLYVAEDLDAKKQWTSVLSATLRVYR